MTTGWSPTGSSGSGPIRSPRRRGWRVRTATSSTSAWSRSCGSRRCCGGCPIGHRMRMIGPKGKFLLEPDDERTHLFVSTGTGIAPFISMIRETHGDGAPRRDSDAQRCSYVDELGYRDAAGGLGARRRATRSRTSRRSRAPSDPRNAGWTGRTGRVETSSRDVCRDLRLRPERTVVYICGNPDMILNTEGIAHGRAASPSSTSRRSCYWPKGKERPGRRRLTLLVHASAQRPHSGCGADRDIRPAGLGTITPAREARACPYDDAAAT